MSIIEKNQIFTLDGADSSYQFKADQRGILSHLWFGEKTGMPMDYLQDYPDVGFSGSPYDAGDERTYSLDTRLLEYPAYGSGDFRLPAIAIREKSGASILDLRYKGFQIMQGKPKLEGLPYVRDEENESQTLMITLEDKAEKVRVKLFYTVFEKENAFCRHAEITNISNETVVIEQAASLSLDLLDDKLDLIHFFGRHAKERTKQRNLLPNGIVEIASTRGTSSHQHNPALILAKPDATETSGLCIGAMLLYSGSFQAKVEKDQLDQTRLVMGIHPDQFEWTLKPGESFTTPEAVLSFSNQGLGKLSRQFHDLINRHVIPKAFQNKPRPVLINNWEATYFDFDDQKILDIAKEASRLGIDMMVLDDGWFGERNNDSEGLGDWDVNEEKLNGPLSKLVDSIHELGMKFGIWVEPEMVSEKSDLYKKHPEWVLKVPGHDPVRGRFQLVLDFSNPEVTDHLFEKLDKLLSENEIDYVKWDMNRSICDWYSPALEPQRQKEIMHRYVLGLYDLLNRLTARHPDVLFEGCSGGGGRFDAGMLFYTPQIWTSDNTDAHDRTIIQEGTSFFYPVSTMGAHVSACPNHQNGRSTSLEARGTVAMHGSFGYEMDLNKLNEEEKELVKEQVQIYKKIQPLVYQGDYYRLSENQDDRSIWSFVSRDKKEAVVMGLLYETRANTLRNRVVLQGLDPDASYRLMATNYEDNPDAPILTGSALMSGGILLPFTWGDNAPIGMLLKKVEK